MIQRSLVRLIFRRINSRGYLWIASVNRFKGRDTSSQVHSASKVFTRTRVHTLHSSFKLVKLPRVWQLPWFSPEAMYTRPGLTNYISNMQTSTKRCFVQLIPIGLVSLYDYDWISLEEGSLGPVPFKLGCSRGITRGIG